jgi:hypothetical protein
MTCGIETGVVAADAALATGKTTVDDLQIWLGRLSQHRDVTHARQAVRLADARSESVGESRTRLLLNAIGFRPTPKSRSATGTAGWSDASTSCWNASGSSSSSMGWCCIHVRRAADATGREALPSEKSREDRLRALGYEFVRLTWADLSRPATVERLIRLAVGRAAARRASWQLTFSLGVSMGTFLARPIRAELDRGQRRALRRSAGGARE